MPEVDFKTADAAVFFDKNLLGSKQRIFLTNNRELFLNAYSTFKVNEDIDHSIVLVDERFTKNTAIVFWRNKNGLVEFCGSGAYATLIYLKEEYNLNKIVIHPSGIELALVSKESKLFLSMNAENVETLSEINQSYSVYKSKKGVLLVELFTDDLLSAFAFRIVESFLNRNNISALCVFYFGSSTCQGKLRYFAPKYGRNEDSVTGSIHSILTPLVRKKYGATHQEWYQLSKEGGKLLSCMENKKVLIGGNCKFITEKER